MKNRIAELRRKEDLNQKELGEYLGVAQTTVSAWERGLNEPDSTALYKMAKLFHASMEYVMGYGSQNIQRGLSSDAYSKYKHEAESEWLERESQEKSEKFIDREDEELEEELKKHDEDEERQKWANGETIAETFEGHKAATLIDGRPKKEREYLVKILEMQIDLLEQSNKKTDAHRAPVI